MSFHESNLVWLDLEMTGLEPKTDKILEIATVITDCDLNVLAEGPVIAIHQSDELLDNMDEWCTNQHGRSGLTARCKASTLSEADAIAQTLDFLKQWVPPGKSPMCGNSIGQDRRFLHKYMPELEAYFHYRNLDVSTIKELARRWRPELLNDIKKKSSHLALDDIKDSIMELKVYQEKFFNL
ncbi:MULTISPECIES: oligoribonuclease [Pseudoalteromonas]|uniref:Oligoribonuclease n=1 Tax=Pseudoalteromonas obscura TaxID=3048491 RepID=A0ABT7EPX3_9GAMM|nr:MULTISPECIES: oligoribonuclease [Pseudoalteromonas]MBQ4839470.1 oligoribonuclease [Pseudoalteromonas luteoviolacea]MDK2597090.1 oligoribonuclease [Pseudoalteromonas sp. P94(2023)]